MIDRIKGIINVEKNKTHSTDDVKINTNINALKEIIKNHGFPLPFAVWKDDNVIYLSMDIPEKAFKGTKT